MTAGERKANLQFVINGFNRSCPINIQKKVKKFRSVTCDWSLYKLPLSYCLAWYRCHYKVIAFFAAASFLKLNYFKTPNNWASTLCNFPGLLVLRKRCYIHITKKVPSLISFNPFIVYSLLFKLSCGLSSYSLPRFWLSHNGNRRL